MPGTFIGDWTPASHLTGITCILNAYVAGVSSRTPQIRDGRTGRAHLDSTGSALEALESWSIGAAQGP
jgi:hypothetical protein